MFVNKFGLYTRKQLESVVIRMLLDTYDKKAVKSALKGAFGNKLNEESILAFIDDLDRESDGTNINNVGNIVDGIINKLE